MEEERRKEFWATLALKYCNGLGARGRHKLLTVYDSACGALERASQWSEIGLHAKVIDEIKNGRWREAARKEWEAANKGRLDFILWTDPAYPGLLKRLPDSPALLYYRGDISLLQSPCIALVGSRKASARGRDVARHLAKNLASCGIAVVSGMADGIDKAAHESALPEIGKSIGVLGTGIDRIYPSSNFKLHKDMENAGLLLSEFAPNTPPCANNFPIRNRIISGLSLACVIVEARKNSGSLITARCALEQNREVFAVPGAAFDEYCSGCQDLVRQGARPVFNAQDILEDMTEALKPFRNVSDKMKESLSQGVMTIESFHENASEPVFADGFMNDERQIDRCVDMPSDSPAGKIIGLLENHPSLTIDCLSETLQIDVEELNAVLLDMEIMGQIQRLPGARIKLQ